MLTREALHRMVDDLPDDLIDRVGDTIRTLCDPVRYAIGTEPMDDERRSPMWRAIAAAPLDDEPQLRASERRLIEERLAQLARDGEVLTVAELAAALR
jgi:hypothetical protein